MKQAVRALSWATNIFWIILLLFTVTAVYSAFQIRPGFQEPSVGASGDTITISLPFILYNGGFYDISKFNITTSALSNRDSTIASSSTLVPIMPKGANTSITHNMSLSIGRLSIDDLSFLLFNDTELTVLAIMKLTYARAFPLEINTNFSVPWGAPMANLAIGGISAMPFNSTHVRALVPLSFDNHSYLRMSGTVRLEIVDNLGNVVGEGATGFDAPSKMRFETDMVVFLSGNPANVREARLYFQTPFFSHGPVVVSLV